MIEMLLLMGLLLGLSLAGDDQDPEPTPDPDPEPEPEPKPEDEPEPKPAPEVPVLEKFKDVAAQAAAYPEAEKRVGELTHETGVLRDLVRNAISGGFLAPQGAARAAEQSPEEEREQRLKPLVDDLVGQNYEKADAEAFAQSMDTHIQRQVLAALEPIMQTVQREVGPTTIQRDVVQQVRSDPRFAALNADEIGAEASQHADLESWRQVGAEERKAFVEKLAFAKLGQIVLETGKLPTVQQTPPALLPPTVGGGGPRPGGMNQAQREGVVQKMIETSEGRVTKEQAEAIVDGKPLPIPDQNSPA